MKKNKIYRFVWMFLMALLISIMTPAEGIAFSLNGKGEVSSVSDNSACKECVSVNSIKEYPVASGPDLFAIDPEKTEDEMLSHYVNMSDWYKIGAWLSTLSEESLDKLLGRDTVLIQETVINEPGKEAKTMRYYEYALEIYNARKDYVYATPAAAAGYWTTKIVKTNSAGTPLKTATITHKITGVDTTRTTAERQTVTMTKSITSNWCDISFSDEVSEMNTYKASADDGTYPLAYSYFNFEKPVGYKVSVSYSITDSVHNLYWNPVQTFKTTESFFGAGGVLNSKIERKVYPVNTTYNGADTEPYLVSYYEGRHYLISLINMYQNAGIGTTSNATNGNLVQTITLTPGTYNVNYSGNGSTSGSVAAQSCTYDQTYTTQQNGYNRAYTITYNGNGGTPAVSSQTATYTFAGWGEGQKTNVDYKAGESFSNLTDHNNGSVTMYAIWNPKSVILPTAKRSGYTLSKWSVGNAGASYTPAKNITATASWTANPYKITLNANGGSAAVSTLNAIYDTAVSLPTPTRPGYAFTGWKDAGGQIYSGMVKNLSSEKNGTVSLTAQWNANGYTIAFDGNGVSDPGPIGATYGLSTTLPSLIRSGYTFAGWKSADGKVYTTSVTNLTEINGATVTLTAQWIPNTYKISLNANGGLAASTSLNATYDTAVSLPTPARAGYVFSGWAGEGGTYKGVVKNLTDVKGATVVLTAQWEANTNTLYKIVRMWEQNEGKEDWGNTPVYPYSSKLSSVEKQYGTTDAVVTISAGEVEGYHTPEAQTIKIIGNGTASATFYYRLVSVPKDYTYRILHYIKTDPKGSYTLYRADEQRVKEDSVVTPPLCKEAIEKINAVKDCYCKEPALQTMTISKQGMEIKYYYDCLEKEKTDEIAKSIAAGLPFCLDIDGVTYDIATNPDGTLAVRFIAVKNKTSITIPDVVTVGEKVYRVTEIQKNAFKNNKKIEKVELSANIGKIADSAFEGCSELKSVKFHSGLVTIGKNAFKNCTSLVSVKTPATLQSIGDSAFAGCKKLKTVTLKKGLVNIGAKAFYRCSSLKKITIPATVLKIGRYSFAKCSKLNTVKFASGASLLAIGEGGFSETAVVNVKLPDKLTKIAKKTFCKCKKLNKVSIGSSVTAIGSHAFRGCSKLTGLSGGEKVFVLYSCAFRDCTSLSKITLQSNMQIVGAQAFYNCKKLKTVTIRSKAITSVGNKAFKKCKKNMVFKVPKSRVGTYKKLFRGKY